VRDMERKSARDMDAHMHWCSMHGPASLLLAPNINNQREALPQCMVDQSVGADALVVDERDVS
jgi:hypothetical protein